jgi:mannose/fructose/N-acetylgalactosamine-specific phosphotransferase system component IID
MNLFYVVFCLAYAILFAAMAAYFAVKGNTFGAAFTLLFTFGGVVMLRWSLIAWAADRRHRAIREEPEED